MGRILLEECEQRIDLWALLKTLFWLEKESDKEREEYHHTSFDQAMASKVKTESLLLVVRILGTDNETEKCNWMTNNGVEGDRI